MALASLGAGPPPVRVAVDRFQTSVGAPGDEVGAAVAVLLARELDSSRAVSVVSKTKPPRPAVVIEGLVLEASSATARIYARGPDEADAVHGRGRVKLRARLTDAATGRVLRVLEVEATEHGAGQEDRLVQPGHPEWATTPVGRAARVAARELAEEVAAALSAPRRENP